MRLLALLGKTLCAVQSAAILTLLSRLPPLAGTPYQVRRLLQVVGGQQGSHAGNGQRLHCSERERGEGEGGGGRGNGELVREC